MKKLIYTISFLSAVALVTVISVAVYKGRIENDLAGKTYSRLRPMGLGHLNVQFDGRDGLISGSASRKELISVNEVISKIEDARKIENRVTQKRDTVVRSTVKVVRVEKIVAKEVPFKKEISEEERLTDIPPRLERLEFNFLRNSDRFVSGKKVARKKIREFVKDNHDPSKVSYKLIGHTDRQGAAHLNAWLGAIRAANVLKLMIKEGADSNQITMVSHGERYPASKEENLSSFKKNRRVELIKIIQQE